MDKARLLEKAAGNNEERILLARVLDKYEQAMNRNQVTATGFMSPQEQALTRSLLHAAGIRSGYCFFGGYEKAERCRLLFAPDWMDESDLPAYAEIGCACCTFFSGDALTHRDFLGSLMALGLTREKLGDILVSSGQATVLTDAAVLPFLLQEYCSAGRTKLSVTEQSLNELVVPEVKTKLIHDTVMSLRLDSICASGFSLSRGRAAELIAAGRVELNWRPCLKSDKAVSEGDTVSCRGLGKFEVAEVGGLSRKGRTNLTIKRYE